MNKIRMIIVDDEALTRKTLAECVPWHDFGVDEIYVAGSGKACLEQCSSFIPDILICDVRMPKMDGITLARRIQSLYPHCCIIFISGYADKEYLKSAIVLKAVRYIEKPISIDEITSVVSECVSIIHKNQSHNEELSKLVSMVESNRKLIQQEIIRLVYENTISSDEIRNHFNPEYFSWDESGLFENICIIFKDERQTHVEKIIRERLDSIREFLSLDYMAGWYDTHTMFVIVRHSMLGSLRSISIEEEISDIISQKSPESFFSIGAGLTCNSFSQLHASLHSSRDTADLWFYNGWNQVFHEKANYSFELPPVNDTDIKDITQVVILTLSTIAAEKNANPAQVYQWCNHIMQTVFSRAENLNYDSLSALRDTIIQRLENKMLLDKKLNNKSVYTRSAFIYIYENFRDTNLNVSMIAEAVGVSPNYLCSIFHKETGEKLKNVITEVRLEEASKLLTSSDLSISQISEKVGFSDPNYFCWVFKHEKGITPTTFRKSGVS